MPYEEKKVTKRVKWKQEDSVIQRKNNNFLEALDLDVTHSTENFADILKNMGVFQKQQ